MTGPRPDPRVGTELGPYRIESVIGRGGMGVVYLATHAGLDRKVALKLLAPDYAGDDAFRARFLRESRMAAAIDHPNIIPIYEAGEIEGTYYLAMRYVAGIDLETRLRAGRIEPGEAVHLLGQVARALDAANEQGLIHRDVKPANILVAAGRGVEKGDHAYLTDFGLTKHRGSQTGLTQSGAFMGTLDYIAPEQIEGRPVDGRADQYGLACVAFHCLTGRVPFARDADIALAMAHLRDAPPSAVELVPELPAEVDAILARGMAKRPDDRFPSCEAFVVALRQALGVRPTGPVPAVAATRRRTPLLAVGVAALLVVAAFVVVLRRQPARGRLQPGVVAGGFIRVVVDWRRGIPRVAVVGGRQRLDRSLPRTRPSRRSWPSWRPCPGEFKQTCQRGSYAVARTAYSGAATPVASLACAPDVTSGATEVLVRQFRPETAKVGIVAGIISSLAGGGSIPPGDCAVSARANGRWSVAGIDRGAIICYADRATGDARLVWAYDKDALLVMARNPRGDAAALYSWFDKHARFMAP